MPGKNHIYRSRFGEMNLTGKPSENDRDAPRGVGNISEIRGVCSWFRSGIREKVKGSEAD